MASYSYDVGETSIRITVTGMDSEGTKAIIYFCRPADTSTADRIEHSVSGTRDSATFSGLESDTDYVINVKVDDDFLGSTNVTTDKPAKVRPSNWSWSSTIRSGASINLSASEWNAFWDKIDEFRDYLDKAPWGSPSTVSRGSPIRGEDYNEAVRALRNTTGSYVLSSVYTGNPIYASDYIALKDALNDID